MLDISISYNRYQFLGNEFLTWIWYMMERKRDELLQIEEDLVYLEIGNRIVIENRMNDNTETITIKGDDAGLEEGILALRKGAVVTEMNLFYKSGEQEWRFTLKGESMHITNLKPPESGAVESSEELEGAVIEKAYLCERVILFLDAAFNRFIRVRISEDWHKKTVPAIKEWIYA